MEVVCLDDVAQTTWQWIRRQKRVGSHSGSFRGRQVGRVGSRCHTTSVRERFTREDECERRGKAAQARVQRGQVSRARQELVGAKLAPKDQTTLNELRGRRPQEQLREIPEDVMSFEPETPVQLDQKNFATCLRRSPSGSSPGPGGCTNEMLRVVLDDPEALFLLTAAAEDFARADVPQCIFGVFMLATMTALQKREGGVRGIATGTSFRRLVAKTLARQFMDQVEETCAPFQFALSTRASTALCEVSSHLQEGELLFANLDDVFVVSKPDRTRFLYDLLANRLHALAGIELHKGKTPRVEPSRRMPAWNGCPWR